MAKVEMTYLQSDGSGKEAFLVSDYFCVQGSVGEGRRLKRVCV